MKNRIIILLVFSFSIASLSLHAQNFWQSVPSPSIDAVTAINVNQRGHIFVGTRLSGMYRSTDAGATWIRINTSLTNLKILCIGILPDSSILIGTHGSGFFKSKFNGDIWQEVGSLTKPSVITGMTVARSGRIYASSFRGPIYSNNGGIDWNDHISGIGYIETTCIALSDSNHAFVGTSDSGVYRSTSIEKYWINHRTGLPASSILSVAVVGGSTVIAGSDGFGAFRSVDSGYTWTPAVFSINPRHINSMVRSGISLFTATELGLFRSENNGVTWDSFGGNASKHSILSLHIGSNGTIYAGTWGGTLLISKDNGASWSETKLATTTPSIRALAIVNSRLYAGTDDGLFSSDDNAATWSHSPLPNIRQIFLPINVIAAKPPFVFTGTEAYGMFRTSDNGIVWSRTANGLTDRYIYGITRGTGSALLCGTSNGTYRTTNDGGSWSAARSGLTSSIIGPMMLVSNTVFAATASGGIFSTTNNGDAWLAQNTGLTNRFTRSIAYHPSGKLLVGTAGDGIFTSTNLGASWQKGIPAVTTSDVTCLLVNAIGYIYAGVDGVGVYRSVDQGATWTLFATGLTNKKVRSMTIDSDGYVYVGTDGGLFRSARSTTSVRNEGQHLPDRASVVFYPNPISLARDGARLTLERMSLAAHSDGTIIEIVDLLGRLQISAVVSMEEQLSRLSLDGLLPGTYFVRSTHRGRTFHAPLVLMP